MKIRICSSPMDVDLKYYPLRDYVGMVSELQSIIRSYNKNSKRNEYAASHNKIGGQIKTPRQSRY